MLYKSNKDRTKLEKQIQEEISEKQQLENEKQDILKQKELLDLQVIELNKKLANLTKTPSNIASNSDASNNKVIAKLGEEVKFDNTIIRINSVSYSNQFSFIDANNGGNMNPSANNGEIYAIIDAEISTELDSAKAASKQKWASFDFIKLKTDKGYSPSSFWENPHPTTIYTGKLNKFQIAASINEGDKISKITLSEPGKHNETTIELN